MKNGTCFLVGASEIARPFSPREGDFVIAADGGYDRLLPLGVRPDLLIGDMDSIAALPAGIETRLFPVRKDETDLFLAFREGFARGYRAFRLVGAGGGLEDHAFANYALLYAARLAGCRAVMETAFGEIRVIVNERAVLKGEPDCRFSAFAFAGPARGVSVRGMAYACEDIALSPEYPLCVSNRFLDRDGEIEVRDGALLIMTERKNPPAAREGT